MNHQKPYEAVIRKCWSDPAFKARLLADPMTVMKEEGMSVPLGVTSVAAIENGPSQLTLMIPPNPDDLTEEQKGGIVSGGYFIFSRGGFSCDFVVHNR